MSIAKVMQAQEKDLIIAGRISGLFGVRGWVKVYSHTDPRENIVDYRLWWVRGAQGWQPMQLVEGQRHGKGVIAHLEGIDDRDAASRLLGADIAIERRDLPTLEQDEYYWADLIGLKVQTETGEVLGTVDHLLETGANDVLVVKHDQGEHLIPYVRDQVIRKIDLQDGVLIVEWDPVF